MQGPCGRVLTRSGVLHYRFLVMMQHRSWLEHRPILPELGLKRLDALLAARVRVLLPSAGSPEALPRGRLVGTRGGSGTVCLDVYHACFAAAAAAAAGGQGRVWCS